MATNRNSYDGSPSPKARNPTAILSRTSNEASLKKPNDWGRKSNARPRDWMKKILQTSDDSGHLIDELADPVERGAHRSPRNAHAPSDRSSWDVSLEFTARDLDFTPQRLQVRNTKLLEIRDDEISIMGSEDEDDEETQDEEEDEEVQRLVEEHERSIQRNRARLDMQEKALPLSPQLPPAIEPVKNRIIPRTTDYVRPNVRQNLQRADVRRDLEEERRITKEDTSAYRQQALERIRHEHNMRVQERARLRALEREESNAYHERTILEEEGERIPGTPITVFGRDSERYSESRSKREDSFEALKNLSKAMTNGTHEDGASSKMNLDPSPGEYPSAEAPLLKLQDNKSDRGLIRAPTPPPVDVLLLPTPKVTGAFIDTPVPQRNRRDETARKRDRSPIKREDVLLPNLEAPRRSESRPAPINSAPRVSAIEDLQTIEKEAQSDESTLGTFDALLQADAAAARTATETSSNEPIAVPEHDAQGKPLSDVEKERILDELTLSRMNRKLSRTSNSIRDTRHGIEHLEQQVSARHSTRNPHGKPIKTDDDQPANSMAPVYYVRIPFPVLRRNNKFTWLGLFCSIFLGWWIAESLMCAQFCHPSSSTSNTWHPSDPFFPYAIPTKLDQWTGQLVSTVAEDIADAWSEWRGPRKRPYQGGPLGSADWYHYLGGRVEKRVWVVDESKEDGVVEEFGYDEAL